MTLEGAQSHVWCCEFSWQTVLRSWSIDGEAALPVEVRMHTTRRRGTQLLATMHGVGRHTQISQIARHIVQTLPYKHCRLVDNSLAYWKPV